MLQLLLVVVVMLGVDVIGGTILTETLQLEGSPEIGYYVELGIGTPYQVLSFLVDTGSSNIVIAGTQSEGVSPTFDPSRSSTFTNTHRTVTINYSQGGFTGYIGTDRLQFISFDVSGVSVAVIKTSWNFFGVNPQWQGILGLAYDSLLEPSSDVVHSLYRMLQLQHSNMPAVFSLQLCPAIDLYGERNYPRGGKMVLGGVDPAHYTGDIFYTPIVKKQYYNVLLSNVSVGGVMVPLECSEMNKEATIVDSGTSDVFVNDALFRGIVKLLKAYFKGRDDIVPPDDFWSGSAQLAWNANHVNIFDVFPVITFYFPLHGNSSMQFGVTMPPQLYLREVDPDGEVTSSCGGECNMFVFGIRSKSTGVILGNNLMNGYTVVFDRDNARLGFAVTTCQLRDKTELHDQPKVTHPEHRDGSVDCSYHGDSSPSTYVTIIITMLCAAAGVLMVIVILYCLHTRHGRKLTRSDLITREILHDQDDNTDDDTVQPAEEARRSGDQLRVGNTMLPTPTETSQSQSSLTVLDIINDKLNMSVQRPVVTESSKKGTSSLVGIQSFNSKYHVETVA